MGVQATMSIDDKTNATVATIASGEAVYPTFPQVRLVSLVFAVDQHREVEVYNKFKALINYARDNNIFVGAGSTAVVSDINGAIRIEAIATNIVDGDIALMIVGNMRNRESRNITENAHRQLLDFMRENSRITK